MDLFEIALNTGGIISTITTIILAFGCAIYWLQLIEKNSHKEAFYFLIIFLTFSYYTTRILGITAYEYFADSGELEYIQKIGFTSLMIVVLYFSMLRANKIQKNKTIFVKNIELFLWLFSISLTITQFFNHSFLSALLLSFGASWQYLFLFYIIISLIKTDKDILSLINSIFIFSIINKLFLVITKGAPLIKSLNEEYSDVTIREGTIGALGPPMSAAGYLAIFLTLGIMAYYMTGKKRYLFYILFVFVEILNTFTRGGIFILFILGLLFFFSVGRQIFRRIAPFLILVVPFYDIIWKYISFRGFNLDVTQESNFVARMALNVMYFQSYYTFSLIGNGILKNTMMNWLEWMPLPLHNAYLELLDVTGIIPFALFIVISFSSLVQLYKLNLFGENVLRTKKFSYISFLFIALLQWVIFANTTSTSIVAYYPYEGTILFWIICFSPCFLSTMLKEEEKILSKI